MSGVRYKVLLVDDDEDDFFMIQDLVSDLPDPLIKLEWVSTYDEATRAITEGRHDAYLVDYRLGAKSGLDLLDEVRGKGVLKAPLILLTGHGDREIDIKAMTHGASDYLVKSQLSGPLLERTIRYSVSHAKVLLEMSESKDSVRNLFDAAFEGIILHDSYGNIFDVNRTAAMIFNEGHPDSINGTNLRSYLSEEAIATLAKPSSNAALKTLGTRRDGATVHLEVSSKPYTYRGQSVVLTACRDISERVQMEAQILQQDRLASIGLLASSLAHEIGTPLGVIRGRAEFILLMGENNANTVKSVDIIISQIDRVSKLIRSLLTLARGQGTGTAVAVDANRIAVDVMELLAHEFSKRKVEAIIDIPNGLNVSAESGPLHQVILNLVVNSLHAIDSAIKAGRDQNHRVRIAAHTAGDRCVLSVEDTGSGISKANMKQLFKPFFTTKDIGVGTGLGLATSYRLVESWGGKIEVESQEGLGTTFKINLPCSKQTPV